MKGYVLGSKLMNLVSRRASTLEASLGTTSVLLTGKCVYDETEFHLVWWRVVETT